MNTDLLSKVEAPFIKTVPKFVVGDTISVHTIIRGKDGEKRRVQIFTGIVISMKGSGARRMFTVRKIGAAGIGVEKIMPLYSPNIEKIEMVKKGKVKRSKLYYLRDRVGKMALKVKQQDFDPQNMEYIEPDTEEEVIEEDQAEETQTDEIEAAEAENKE